MNEIGIDLRSIRGEAYGVPRLVLNFAIENNSESAFGIVNVTAEVLVSSEMVVHDNRTTAFMGFGTLESDPGQLTPRSKGSWSFVLAVEPYALQKLEEVRKKGDLFLQIRFLCVAAIMDASTATPVKGLVRPDVRVGGGYSGYYCPFKVPQSDWEKTLDELGYRDAVRVEEEIAHARQRVGGMSREIESILEKAKDAAVLVGVAAHAVHFDKDASKHNKVSWYWLTATVGLAVAGIIYSLWSFQQTVAIPSTGSTGWWPHVTYITSRLLVLSIVFFGLTWCARNYRASKHNETVNRHRQNALRTFETFAMAAEDKDIKDAVLLQATRSIFEAQSSGYLSGEAEKLPSNTVIEVLRKAMSKEEPS